MTKQEVYKSLIKIQKESGQGLSGIVRAMGTNSGQFNQYLDELIEEGLVKACATGGSLGHPESNIFYMPTKGYNVWEDDGIDGEYSRHKGRYLTNVRLYLGALSGDESVDMGNENDTRNRKFLNPAAQDLIQNADFMVQYGEWLKRNEKALEEMKNLDDYYDSPVINFSEDELKDIRSKKWYETNETVEKCLKESIKKIGELKERISLNNQLIKLYKDPLVGTKYKTELEKSLTDIKDDENDILFRKKLHSWMESQDMKTNIQVVIS